MSVIQSRVRRFRKNFFCFKVKRSENEIRFACSHEHFFFASFRFKFFASDHTKNKRVYFRFVLQKFFTSLPIFLFVSLQSETKETYFALFRFEAKRNKHFFASFHNTRYRIEKLKRPALMFFYVSLQIVPEFHFILFCF
jgi:hypothetical protein